MPGQAVHLGPRPLLDRHTVNDSWALTTYDACSMRCTYCITRAQGVSRPKYPADQVADQLRSEHEPIPQGSRIGVGTYADVYPDIEADLGVTRAALAVLVEQERPFNLVTKGPTVTRDIDLFRLPGTEIQVSVCTLDLDFLHTYEPGVVHPDLRLAAANELAAAGVTTIVQCAPWVPGVSDVPALRARLDDAVLVQVTPLRLPDYLDRAARSFPYEQPEINEAYQRAYEEAGDLPGVRWSRPPALDGSPPHIVDNVGHRRPASAADWVPAAPAPDPGAPKMESRRRAITRRLAELARMTDGDASSPADQERRSSRS